MVDHRSDAQFMERLAATRRAVDDFAREQLQKVDSEEKQFLQQLADCKAKLQRLQEDDSELENQVAIDSKALEETKQKLVRLKEHMKQLAEQEATFPSKLEAQDKTRKQLMGKLVEEESAVAESQSLNSATIEELQIGLELYRKLGIDFNRKEDNLLELAFRYIDPTDPEKQFSITLFIDDNDLYRVHAMHPAVPHITDLVDALNTSNDFSQFVQSLRSKFQAMAI